LPLDQLTLGFATIELPATFTALMLEPAGRAELVVLTEDVDGVYACLAASGVPMLSATHNFLGSCGRSLRGRSGRQPVQTARSAGIDSKAGNLTTFGGGRITGIALLA
jgi:hypothetical protein